MKPQRAPWPFPNFSRAKRERKTTPVSITPVSLRLPAQGRAGEKVLLRRIARMVRKQMDDPGITPQALLACRETLRRVTARLAVFK